MNSVYNLFIRQDDVDHAEITCLIKAKENSIRCGSFKATAVMTTLVEKHF